MDWTKPDRHISTSCSNEIGLFVCMRTPGRASNSSETSLRTSIARTAIVPVSPILDVRSSGALVVCVFVSVDLLGRNQTPMQENPDDVVIPS